MKIKKADIILAIVIAIVGIAASFYLTFLDVPVKNGKVVIHQNNKVYGEYSLYEDREITVKDGDHINKITIKNGNVQMTFSNCKNQDCVKQGSIDDSSKSIVCLPHKVVVEIKSDKSEFDSVSR